MEVFGLMQQIYNRAQHSLGPDVGCYAPPKLWENELNESLQVGQFKKKIKTTTIYTHGAGQLKYVFCHYLLKSWKINVKISKCICPHLKMYLSKFQNVFVHI